MILHKYREDNEYTEKIFVSKEVWLSTPAKLNDPFEAALRMPHEETRRKTISQMRQSQISGFILSARRAMAKKQFFGLSKADTIALVNKFKGFKTEDEAYEAFANFMEARTGTRPSNPEHLFPTLQSQAASVGIFSLSEIPDNSLMWAHYARDHKGICIGFEVTHDGALSDEERFLQVRYSDVVPQLDEHFMTHLSVTIDKHRHIKTTHQVSFSDPTLRAAISTKGGEWAYEREWRYVEPSAGAFKWPGPIVEITFGLNCTHERREHYVNLVRDNVPNDVRFYEIRTKSGSREFERVRIPPLIEEFDGDPTADDIKEVEALLEARRYLKALSILEKVLKASPESAELWRQQGIAFGWCDDHATALECFEKSTFLQPHHSSAWYQKGVALTQLERYEEAIMAYKEARKLGLNDPSIAFNLGSIFMGLEEYELALKEIRLAKKCGHPRAENKLRLIEQFLASNL